MELNHFALSLKNQQLLRNIDDTVLKTLQHDLLNIVGGFRKLFSVVLKHPNITHNQHQQLFTILHATTKKAQELKDKQSVHINDEQKIDDEIKMTLCSLNETCLSYLFTFLDSHSHKTLQRGCINLYIAGSVRAAFLSNDDMINAGYFPHLIHHVNIINNYNDIETDKILKSLSSMGLTLSTRPFMPEIFLSSGYSNILITLALNTNNVDILRTCIGNIVFLTEKPSSWVLINYKVFDMIKKVFNSIQVKQMGTIRNAINIAGDLINHNDSLRERAINIGVLDALLFGMKRWKRKAIIISALNLLNLLLPKKHNICIFKDKTITNETMIRNILNVYINYIKQFIKWICDEKYRNYQHINAILVAFSRSIHFIHNNYFKIDFVELKIEDDIDKIFKIAIFEAFNILAIGPKSKFHDTLLLLLQVDWSLINKNQNVIEKAIECDIGNTFVQTLLQNAALHSKKKLAEIYELQWLRDRIRIVTPQFSINLFAIHKTNDVLMSTIVHAMANASSKEFIELIYDGNDSIKQIHSCGNCMQLNSTKRCSRCKRIYYCSEQCQASHWIKHKSQCKLYHSNNVNIVKLLSLFDLEMDKEVSVNQIVYFQNFVLIFMKIITVCNEFESRFDKEEIQQIKMDCKAAICSFWGKDNILEHFKSDIWVADTFMAHCIHDILLRSLIVGEDIYKIFIFQNGWIIDKITDVEQNDSMDVFYGFLQELCMKLNVEMTRKLIDNGGILRFFEYLLSKPETLNWAKLRGVLECVNNFMEVDSTQILIKIPNLKKLLMDANYYDDINSREYIKTLIDTYFA